jgi:hypothetical protein
MSSVILGPSSGFRYCQTVLGFLRWGAFLYERTGLSCTIAAGSLQRSHSRVGVPWDPRPHFPQIRDSLNLEGQVPIFVSLRNRVIQLYTQVLDSLFVTSRDSQGSVFEPASIRAPIIRIYKVNIASIFRHTHITLTNNHNNVIHHDAHTQRSQLQLYY